MLPCPCVSVFETGLKKRHLRNQKALALLPTCDAPASRTGMTAMLATHMALTRDKEGDNPLNKLSKLTVTGLLAVSMALPLSSSSFAQAASPAGASQSIRTSEGVVVPVRSRRGRNIGLGIAAVVGTAIILSAAARADGRRRYGRGDRCWDLLDRCEDGYRRACYRYEDLCQ